VLNTVCVIVAWVHDGKETAGDNDYYNNYLIYYLEYHY